MERVGVSESGPNYCVFSDVIAGGGSNIIALDRRSPGKPVKHIDKVINNSAAADMTLELVRIVPGKAVAVTGDFTDADDIPLPFGTTSVERAALAENNIMVQATHARISGVAGDAFVIRVTTDL